MLHDLYVSIMDYLEKITQDSPKYIDVISLHIHITKYNMQYNNMQNNIEATAEQNLREGNPELYFLLKLST